MAKKETNLQKFGHLPRLVQENDVDNKNRKKILDIKEQYRSLSSTELATAYTKLRDEKDDLEEELKAQNAMIQAVTELIVDQFEKDEVTGVRTAEGYFVSTKYDPYASVKDKAAFVSWVKENGYEDMLTLPWQTTNSLTKALIEAGEAPPDGVEVFLKTGLRLLRG